MSRVGCAANSRHNLFCGEREINNRHSAVSTFEVPALERFALSRPELRERVKNGFAVLVLLREPHIFSFEARASEVPKQCRVVSCEDELCAVRVGAFRSEEPHDLTRQ